MRALDFFGQDNVLICNALICVMSLYVCPYMCFLIRHTCDCMSVLRLVCAIRALDVCGQGSLLGHFGQSPY